MPARSSASSRRRLSASDISSGSVTQWKRRPAAIAQPLRDLARPAPRAARSADRPPPGRADARQLLADQPMLVLQRVENVRRRPPTVSGAASSRSVCPVGAVSTTITSYTSAARRQRTISMQADELVDPGNDRSSSASTSSRSSQVPCSRMSPSARRCSPQPARERARARRARPHASAGARTRRGARRQPRRRARRRASARDRSRRRARARPAAGARPTARSARRARRLADAALAAEEDES